MTKKRSTLSPRIERINLVDLVDSDGDQLDPHQDYDRERFIALDLSDRDLAGTIFTECEFLDLAAHETQFRSASFIDTRFEGLSAPLFQASQSRLRNVEVTGSRLGSAEFDESHWQSVTISNSKLGFVNLRHAKMVDVVFSDCLIEELDMASAKANRIAFVNTTVNNIDFTRASLQNVDLRALELRKISGGLESLNGTTMTPYQTSELASVFAEHFGINVME